MIDVSRQFEKHEYYNVLTDYVKKLTYHLFFGFLF